MKKVVLIFFILSIYFVSATHTATISSGASSYSKIQNESLIYNISISNEGIGQNANITQVKIILPPNFTFEIGSQGTSASSTDFTKKDTELIWEDLETYLINGSETEYFWFKASASLVGEHYLSITTIDINGSDNSIIPVKVTPTEATSCTSNWTCSKWSQCVNSTQTRNCTDQNNCNNQTGRSLESQSCSMPCTPNWTCTEWSKCIDLTQTKTCTDLNNCNTTQEKPSTEKTCTPKEEFNWLFLIIIATIILAIIGIVIYLIKTLRKQSQIKTNQSEINSSK